VSQPIDLQAIYDKVLGEHSNDRGLLPIELQKASYHHLDALTTSALADKGLRNYTADQYESALRDVVDELLSETRSVSPRLPVHGAALSDRAEELLVSRGTSMKDATFSQFMDALADARDVLDLEARRDALTAVRSRLVG